MTIRVMTWNLWWRFGPWEDRLPAISYVVGTEGPDVLLAQEVWSMPGTSLAHELAEALNFHAAISDDPFAGHREVEQAGFHNAIVSRWPIIDVVSHPLPQADGSDGHRRALIANLDTPWGPWPVVSTHFEYRFDATWTRLAQAERLLEIVASTRGEPTTALPPIVGGDLNAVPDSDEIRTLTGRRASGVGGVVLSDCWEQAGDGPGTTWRHDNPYQQATAWPNRRIDYVMVAWPRPKPVGNPQLAWLAGLEPVNGTVPSDHAAVVVELRTPGDE